ncbi:hypothetical protein BJ508DRAFT_303906 [Ascobolus immersus RN42]|uniref:F-box domain-containing protein n=1 Tax=Ascobolus immersus RN42 TaxID=1160509 RepID=A0A3N4IF78_ASCIM|nr:hypothetical protein BJ508DRAFT_303906 [Ascobolus immersus RN42]
MLEQQLPLYNQAGSLSALTFSSPPPSSPLLRLPVELRLIIYRSCSAFTLLQLSQSHPTLRTELNSIPDILTTSYGYTPAPLHQLSFRNIEKVASPLEAILFYHQREWTRASSSEESEAYYYNGDSPGHRRSIGVVVCRGCYYASIDVLEGRGTFYEDVKVWEGVWGGLSRFERSWERMSVPCGCASGIKRRVVWVG